MPLFRCENCDAVENAALGRYWFRHRFGGRALCSECATGTWHGRFPKETAGTDYVPDPIDPNFIVARADLPRN